MGEREECFAARPLAAVPVPATESVLDDDERHASLVLCLKEERLESPARLVVVPRVWVKGLLDRRDRSGESEIVMGLNDDEGRNLPRMEEANTSHGEVVASRCHVQATPELGGTKVGEPLSWFLTPPTRDVSDPARSYPLCVEAGGRSADGPRLLTTEKGVTHRATTACATSKKHGKAESSKQECEVRLHLVSLYVAARPDVTFLHRANWPSTRSDVSDQD